MMQVILAPGGLRLSPLLQKFYQTMLSMRPIQHLLRSAVVHFLGQLTTGGLISIRGRSQHLEPGTGIVMTIQGKVGPHRLQWPPEAIKLRLMRREH